MKPFDEKKNIILNLLTDRVKENDAFKAVWGIWNNESDYSTVESLISAVRYISEKEALSVVQIMIEENIFAERLLYKLCNMIKQSQYIIGNKSDDIENFKEFVLDVIKTHFRYDLKVLYQFAYLLEYMFAIGYRSWADLIFNLYDVLPDKHLENAQEHIHKQLVRVYGYNGMNYTALKNMLYETHEYCKFSKQKFMYGEIYYYHAVLEILSKNYYSRDLHEYLGKACRSRFNLAFILKSHTDRKE